MLKSLKTNFSTQNVEACENPQQMIFFEPAHLCIFSYFTITLLLIWLECNSQVYSFRPYVKLADK